MTADRGHVGTVSLPLFNRDSESNRAHLRRRPLLQSLGTFFEYARFQSLSALSRCSRRTEALLGNEF